MKKCINKSEGKIKKLKNGCSKEIVKRKNRMNKNKIRN